MPDEEKAIKHSEGELRKDKLIDKVRSRGVARVFG